MRLAASLCVIVVVLFALALLSGGGGWVGANHSAPGTVDTHIVHVHDDLAAVPTTGFFHPEPLTFADHAAAQAACQAADPAPECDINIETGDSVEWWSKSPFHANSHTVTECTDDTFGTCGAAVDPDNPVGDSGVFVGGAASNTLRYGPVTFNTVGTFYYLCQIHGGVMRGRVVVTAAQTATPTPTPAPSATAAPAVSPTATPARVPATGGPPGDGGLPRPVLLAVLGAVLLAGSVGVVVRGLRRES